MLGRLEEDFRVLNEVKKLFYEVTKHTGFRMKILFSLGNQTQRSAHHATRRQMQTVTLSSLGECPLPCKMYCVLDVECGLMKTLHQTFMHPVTMQHIKATQCFTKP
jgi:hypothetical protein